MAICERCGKEHDGSYGSGRFCSKYCANKRDFSKDIKEKISKHRTKLPDYFTKICPKCGKEFTVDKKHRKTKFCSRSCANGHIVKEETKQKISQSINRFLQSGNSFYSKRLEKYKEDIHKNGVSKHGIYKGYYCDSTFELVFLIYCLDHNISINRCTIGFDCFYGNKNHKYYADFQCGHKNIIEIKGIHNRTVEIKAKAIPAKYNYCILYKEDLKKYFDYVCSTYKVSKKNLHSLYEMGCAPKIYTFTCSVCGKVYTSLYNHHRKYNVCSKKCACMVKHIKFKNNLKANYVLDKYKMGL